MSQRLEESKRTKLSTVKTGIYNSYLPTWRTINMEDQLGKLCDEHVRSSLPVGIELSDQLFYQYNSSSHYIPNYEVLPLYFMQWEDDKSAKNLSFLNNPNLEERWKEFKKYLPLGMHRIEHIPQVKDFQFMNYHVRYRRPEARNAFKGYPTKEKRVRSKLQILKDPLSQQEKTEK